MNLSDTGRKYKYNEERDPSDLHFLGERYALFLEEVKSYSPTLAAKRCGFVWQVWRKAIVATKEGLSSYEDYLRRAKEKKRNK